MKAMLVQLVPGIKFLATLVALILTASWEMDTLNMSKRITNVVADLAAQIAMELSNVLPFSDFARVSMKVLQNSSSMNVFPTGLHSIILYLQCSEVLKFQLSSPLLPIVFRYN